MTLTHRNRLKFLLPLMVILAATAGAVVLATSAKPQMQASNASPPIVKTLLVQPQRVKLPVQTHGILQPVREIGLISQVQGRIAALHDSFVVGGGFKVGDVLVAVESAEYDLAIVRSETRLAEAKRILAEEQAASTQAQREWKVLGEGAPTPLSLREPQLQEAKAKLKQAEAEWGDAKLQRSHCEIRAPFNGHVKEKLAGVGQMAEIGKSLGRIYADGMAEIRLPLSQAQIGYLPTPEVHNGKTIGAKVTLTAERGVGQVQRQAMIVRREGIVDQNTGLEYWVARLEHPEQAPALLPGTFVSAEIEGRELDGVFELPRGAVNAAQEILWVDADSKLQIKRLQVLHSDAERVWVGAGLSAGERVIVSGVEVPVAGMAVIAESADGSL
ncbi:MAG: efflux RND transporter periplasmic adaptor subunit [Aquabacterium sp.]|uniref:efflux RND transporter periplasmic adaptor subunit n=1 Tax=Aquabacterium sp. TaxID=1872578 RepID=UPI0027271DA3|nr:efflux RND transporter periplasmic adaptor subunit [Aquabacterium sp.]MDO9006527.1 efflux RND transporter periplasmic adaptor subunit [Aquabacterium sp.]